MQYLSRTNRFIEKNRHLWERMLELHRRPLSRWTAEEYRRFPADFRRLCSHLSQARQLELSRKLILFLNSLVGECYHLLYEKSILRKRNLVEYLWSDVPGFLARSWKFIFTSACIFLGSFILTLGLVRMNPGIAEDIVGASTVEMFETMYVTDDFFSPRQAEASTAGASFYIQHNISIAFSSFALGVVFGVGTVYILLYNGLYLGSIAGHISTTDGQANFWAFVAAHGVFELSGLIIAGAAGLLLGWTIIHPGIRSRVEALKAARERITGLLVPATIFLLMAALIEGGLSPQPVGMAVRLAVAALSGVVVIAYMLRGRFTHPWKS